MKTKSLGWVVLSMILIHVNGFGQQSGGLKPTVNITLDQLVINENFDSSGTGWTTISNSENLILVQDGEYILNRKAPTAPFASMGNIQSDLDAYRLVTAMKLDKSSVDEATIGLIFMAQKGGQGGFIFEFNKKQEYRLRQITNGVYRFLTGSSEDGGWMKSAILKAPGLPNLIEVKTFEKKYDLLLNNVLILSFSEIAYKTGEIGFLIGPSSKGRVDFLYLFTNQEHLKTNNASNEAIQTTDIVSLTESIIQLKSQINKLKVENDMLKATVSSMKTLETDFNNEKKEQQKQVLELEKQIKKEKFSNDSLKQIVNELNKFKEIVGGNENGDLIINLSRQLKLEKLKNEELNKKLTQMQSNPNRNNQQKDSLQKENQNGFVLPKEN